MRLSKTRTARILQRNCYKTGKRHLRKRWNGRRVQPIAPQPFAEDMRRLLHAAALRENLSGWAFKQIPLGRVLRI
jgi:hypothetical protein